MRPRRVAIAAAVIAALATRAAADPAPTPATPAPELAHYVHLESPSTVTTDGGSTVRLPPGYFLDEPNHDKLEAGVKDLQDTRTRLTAENASMRSALDGWQPGFYSLLSLAAGGFVLGLYLGHKL